MAKSDQVLRFAVGTPDGLRSAVYRVWAPETSVDMKEDVYLALWRMGDEFRISLHGERENLPPVAQQAVTKETRDRVGLDSRILNAWPRVQPSAHFEPEFEVVVPTSELYRELEGDDRFENVTWIPAAPRNGVVQVCISFHNPGEALVGSQLLSRFQMREGRSCWIVAITREEVPAEFNEQLRRGKARLRSAKPTFSIGEPDLDEVGTRVQLGLGRNGRHCGWVEASFQADAPALAALPSLRRNCG